jgi:hypothetical protein
MANQTDAPRITKETTFAKPLKLFSRKRGLKDGPAATSIGYTYRRLITL